MITNLTENKIIQPVYSPNIIQVTSDNLGLINHKFVWDIYVSFDLGLTYEKVSRLKTISNIASKIEISDILKSYIDENHKPIERTINLLKVQVKVGEEYGISPVLYDGNDIQGDPSVIVSTYQATYASLMYQSKDIITNMDGDIYQNYIPYMSVIGNITGDNVLHLKGKPLTNKPLNMDLYEVKSKEIKGLRNYNGDIKTINNVPEFKVKLYEPIFLYHYMGKVINTPYNQPNIPYGSYDIENIEKGYYKGVKQYDMFYNHPKKIELKFYDPSGRYINEQVIYLSDYMFMDEESFKLKGVDVKPRFNLSPDLIGFNDINGTIGDILDQNIVSNIGPGTFNVSVERPPVYRYFNGRSLCDFQPPDELVVNATFNGNNNWGFFSLDKNYVDLGDVGKPEVIGPTPTPEPTPEPVYSWNIVITDFSGDPCVGGDEFVLYGTNPNFLLNDVLYSSPSLVNPWIEPNVKKVLVDGDIIYEWDGEAFIGTLGSCQSTPTPTPTTTTTTTATPTPTPTTTTTTTATPTPTPVVPTATPTPTPTTTTTTTATPTPTPVVPTATPTPTPTTTTTTTATPTPTPTISGVYTFDVAYNQFIPSALDGLLTSMIQTSNGDIFVAYSGFLNASTMNYVQPKIKKYDSNGVEDTTYVSPTFNGTPFGVYAMEQTTDGYIYIGGDFTSVNGNTIFSKFTRLNSDGTFPADFGNLNILGGDVYDIKQASNGDIYVGGSFTQAGGNTSRRGLFSLTSAGAWNRLYSVDGDVYSIKETSDGYIYIGGDFTSFTGSSIIKKLARLLPNGLFDSNNFVLTSFGADTSIRVIEQTPNGEIYLGGDINEYNGNTNYSGLIKFNSNGTIDTTYTAPTFAKTSGYITRIVGIKYGVDNKLYVSGSFDTINGVDYKGFGRFNSDDTLDTTFTEVFSQQSSDILETTNNKLYWGGGTATFNSTSYGVLLRLTL